MLVRVLVAFGAGPLQERILRLLAGSDLVVLETQDGALPADHTTLPVCDLVLVGRALMSEPASESVAKLRSLPDAPEVVVVADRDDASDRESLLAAGCRAVLSAGVDDAALGADLGTLVAARRIAQQRDLAREREAEPMSLGDFATRSPGMREFLQIARKVCATDSSVLILGETGVGKERLARAIHGESPRSAGPFIPVHCGAIPEGLLESELFGHERGAFTGAIRAHRGYFEVADGGTLFLDEVGDMAPPLQVKLLRALQEHQVQPLGSEKPRSVDVRVLAATHRDLYKEMGEGRFRADLFYRLSVVSLTIPPLRERREDIAPLVDGFLQRFRRQFPAEVQEVDDSAMKALRAYPWPGNVRELANVMERAVLLCPGRAVTLADLPEGIASWAAEREPAVALPEVDRRWLDKPLGLARSAFLLAFERCYLDGLLRDTGGRVGETARRAGIDPRSIYTKMRRHGLRKEDYRRARGGEGSESPRPTS